MTHNYLIGDKIRYYRKKKHVSLKELADGICSIGKMSNIENGQSNVTTEELELIASKLGVSYDDLKTSSEKVDNLVESIHVIEDLLYLNQYNEAHKRIEEVTELYNSQLLPDRSYNIEIYYINGLYYYFSNEQNKSIHYLLQATQCRPSKNNEKINFKIKSEMLLSRIYYEKQNFNSSLKHLVEAKQLSNSKISVFYNQRNSIHLNLCIHYLLLGKLQSVNIIMNEIDLQTQPLVLLIKAVLSYLEKDYTKTRNYVDSIRRAAKETGNIELILKSSALRIKLAIIEEDHLEYAKEVAFLKNYMTTVQLPTNQVFILLAQFYIEEAIKLWGGDHCDPMFTYLFDAQKKAPHLTVHYRTHHLYATFLKKTTNDYDAIKYHLNMALDYCPEENQLTKAIIAHEYADLICSKETPYTLSSQFFYNHYIEKEKDYNIYFILPSPIF